MGALEQEAPGARVVTPCSPSPPAAPQVRKGDVVAAAKAKGASFVESHYNKIMRELCRNNAGAWTTKAGVGE